MVHALKGLQHVVPLIIIDPVLADEGWQYRVFNELTPGADNPWKPLHERYTSTDPLFTGRVTVPLLWDSKTKKIINNDSQDITMLTFKSAKLITDCVNLAHP